MHSSLEFAAEKCCIQTTDHHKGIQSQIDEESVATSEQLKYLYDTELGILSFIRLSVLSSETE